MSKEDFSERPWTSGPSEILRHAMTLIRDDTDSNRRLAFLSVDNSVEIMIKSFLDLPKRITGLSISRKKKEEYSRSFPMLLDAIEEYAEERTASIDLGEIEWYHQLRNQLYHQGNGLTVERQKVVVYFELAKQLFESLFDVGFEADRQTKEEATLEGYFTAWKRLESTLKAIASELDTDGKQHNPMALPVQLANRGLLDQSFVKELSRLRERRNMIVHGEATSVTHSLADELTSLQDATERLTDVLNNIKEESDSA